MNAVCSIENAVVIEEHKKTLQTKALRYGADAWLIEFATVIGDDSFATAAMIRQQLHECPPAALQEITFSSTRVLLEFDRGKRPENAPVFYVTHSAPTTPEPQVIEVCYDGPDLERVASHCRMSIDDVIRHHSEGEYRVHFLGFAPGFPYLSGLPSMLHTPRLDNPRILIPAGSVGIGGSQTGIYPLPTPGGWNLIGRVNLNLFDPKKNVECCTRFQAGDIIRFHAVTRFS